MNISQRKICNGEYENTDVSKSLYPCTRPLSGSYLIQRGVPSYKGRLVNYDVRLSESYEPLREAKVQT